MFIFSLTLTKKWLPHDAHARVLSHTGFHKTNPYNNIRRTNRQKRKSARIWTYRKNKLRTLTELTKHYPIFRKKSEPCTDPHE